jgi:putative spermidine/putrescine transport system ATP-binding protein
VFVTHDQEEALAMSDRIAVMNAGRVEQVGAPAEIYDRPRTRFVADFIGEINLFDGNWDGGRFVAGDGRTLPAVMNGGRSGTGALAVRPEKARIVAPADGAVAGRIESANFLGGQVLYRIASAGDRHLLAKETNVGDGVRAVGVEVGLAWNAADAVVLED